MKKITIVSAVVAAAAAAVGAIIVVAQVSHRGKFGNHFQGFAEHHEKIVEHLATELKMTGAQATQAKRIIADAKPRFDPLLERLKQAHKASGDLGVNSNFDEQKAQESAARQAEVVKQIVVEMERTKAALFAVLMPEQREQAKRVMNDFVENINH
jgi:Spy/CpxP family protein refolding chaperone